MSLILRWNSFVFLDDIHCIDRCSFVVVWFRLKFPLFFVFDIQTPIYFNLLIVLLIIATIKLMFAIFHLSNCKGIICIFIMFSLLLQWILKSLLSIGWFRFLCFLIFIATPHCKITTSMIAIQYVRVAAECRLQRSSRWLKVEDVDVLTISVGSVKHATANYVKYCLYCNILSRIKSDVHIDFKKGDFNIFPTAWGRESRT